MSVINGHRRLVPNEGSAFLFRNEQHETRVSVVLVIWGEDFVLVELGKCVTIFKQNFVMIIG